MDEVLLGLLWVAAYHGLRAKWPQIARDISDLEAYQPRVAIYNHQWTLVHDLTSALGNPPAPGGPR